MALQDTSSIPPPVANGLITLPTRLGALEFAGRQRGAVSDLATEKTFVILNLVAKHCRGLLYDTLLIWNMLWSLLLNWPLISVMAGPPHGPWPRLRSRTQLWHLEGLSRMVCENPSMAMCI